jgi:hypothetical protein
MTPDKTIEAELNSISPLIAGLPRQLPYRVPAGYFNQLSGLLLEKVRAADQAEPASELAALSPLLAGLSKKPPFSIPEGYFEKIGEEVSSGLSGILQTNEVLETLPALLFTARNINPYTVPAAYFEQFPHKMLGKVKVSAPVVSIKKHWLQYAAAAIVAGIIAIGAWLYFQPSVSDLAVPADMALDLHKEIDQLSDQTILEYADSTQSLSFSNSMASNDELNGPDIHFLLEDVSDGDLQEYLIEQQGKVILLNN